MTARAMLVAGDCDRRPYVSITYGARMPVSDRLTVEDAHALLRALQDALAPDLDPHVPARPDSGAT